MGETVLLSNRIVMMTNGPSAHIGEVLEVSIPRLRERLELASEPGLLEMSPSRAGVRLQTPPPRRGRLKRLWGSLRLIVSARAQDSVCTTSSPRPASQLGRFVA
jgi:hypothetical protein